MFALKCPECGKTIRPILAGGGGSSAAGEEENGKRWSFIWRLPRGEVCPECDVPISRYAYRRKGINLFLVSLALLAAATLLFLLAMMSGFPGRFVQVVGVIVAVAVLSVLMGLAGIIVRGRHAIELSSPDSA